jgi:hypothetical protein
VALGRVHLSVLSADALEIGDVGLGREGGDRIRAEQAQGHLAGEVVPQPLELDRCLALAPCPEHGDHLPERVHACPAAADAPDDGADQRIELRRIGAPVDHESAERLFGVECDVRALLACDRDGDTAGLQLPVERLAVCRGGDDHQRVPAPDRRRRESGDDVDEEGIRFVELHDVRCGREADRLEIQLSASLTSRFVNRDHLTFPCAFASGTPQPRNSRRHVHMVQSTVHRTVMGSGVAAVLMQQSEDVGNADLRVSL